MKNALDCLASAAIGSICCAGAVYVFIPVDPHEVRSSLQIGVQARRGIRRLGLYLDQCPQAQADACPLEQLGLENGPRFGAG